MLGVDYVYCWLCVLPVAAVALCATADPKQKRCRRTLFRCVRLRSLVWLVHLSVFAGHMSWLVYAFPVAGLVLWAASAAASRPSKHDVHEYEQRDGDAATLQAQALFVDADDTPYMAIVDAHTSRMREIRTKYKRRYWLCTFPLAFGAFSCALLWSGLAFYEPGFATSVCVFASNTSCEEVVPGWWHAVESNTTIHQTKSCDFIWNGLFKTQTQCRGRLLDLPKKRRSDCVLLPEFKDRPRLCLEAVRVPARLGPDFWGFTVFFSVVFTGWNVLLRSRMINTRIRLPYVLSFSLSSLSSRVCVRVAV